MSGASALKVPKAAASTDKASLRLRVATVAGGGRIGASDGAAEDATFSFPHSVLPLVDGSALVTDCGNDAVRHISIDPQTGGYLVRRVGGTGFTWLRPRGLAQLPDGGVLVCDSGHNRIRMLGADGSVSVFAGSGRRGFQDGPASIASFDAPSSICVCADGSVLVADTNNHAIRAITISASGTKRTVTTLAGSGHAGGADGVASAACFCKPAAVLALGPIDGITSGEGVVYVADAGNHAIRMISATALGKASAELCVATLCGKAGSGGGHVDGALADALFGSPTALAMLPDGSIAVSDAANNNVRRVCFQSKRVSTLAGADGSRAWGLVDGPGVEARFNTPRGLSAAPNGELWLADCQNHCVRLLVEDARAIAPLVSAAPPPPSPKSKESWMMTGPTRMLPPAPKPSQPAAHRANPPIDVSDGFPMVATGAPPPAAAPAQPMPAPAAPPIEDHDGALIRHEGHEMVFDADAQLFERAVPTTKRGEARGGWTYTGTAAVMLRRCAPRAAMLSVQVLHGAATAEVSVVRPSQLTLRDTAFVVCARDPHYASGGGYNGFGANELGLRFRSTAAAASLIAACEAIVGVGGGGDEATACAGGQIQQAEEDVLRLSARLAERDMEAKRMLRQLEHSQAVVRSRDAKVAELSRRVAQLSSKPGKP